MGTHVELLDRQAAIALPVAALAAMPDPALARRVLGGEERPFEVLYGRYKNPLYRYCAAFLRNPEDAEDALQAAMTNAFRALSHGVPGELVVRPWLYRIAHRECLNILRRRTAHEELTGGEEAPGGGVAERAERSEQIRQLAADLAELAPRARQALLLRELGGLSHAEIGIALDATATVARNLVYEARQALEELHEGRGLDCAAVQRTLSDGDGRALRGRRMGAHMRACAGCRTYRERLAQRPKLMAAMVPAVLPAAAARRILDAATGSLGTAGGGGVVAGTGAAVGTGAVASAGSSIGVGILGVKGLVAVVAALAGTAAVATPLTLGGIGSGAPPGAVHRASAARLAAPAHGLPAGLLVVVADGPSWQRPPPAAIAPIPIPLPQGARAPVEGAAVQRDGGAPHILRHGSGATVAVAVRADAGPGGPVGTAGPVGSTTRPVAAPRNERNRPMGVTADHSGARAVPATKRPAARPGTTAAGAGRHHAPERPEPAHPPGAAGAAAAGSSTFVGPAGPHDGAPPARVPEEPSEGGAAASSAENGPPGDQGVPQLDTGTAQAHGGVAAAAPTPPDIAPQPSTDEARDAAGPTADLAPGSPGDGATSAAREPATTVLAGGAPVAADDHERGFASRADKGEGRLTTLRPAAAR